VLSLVRQAKGGGHFAADRVPNLDVTVFGARRVQVAVGAPVHLRRKNKQTNKQRINEIIQLKKMNTVGT
jgi:hypothetical protein